MSDEIKVLESYRMFRDAVSGEDRCVGCQASMSDVIAENTTAPR
jgi:hypothetical protein